MCAYIRSENINDKSTTTSASVLVSTSSRHIGTLGKSFTRNCLYAVMQRPVWLLCS